MISIFEELTTKNEWIQEIILRNRSLSTIVAKRLAKHSSKKDVKVG